MELKYNIENCFVISFKLSLMELDVRMCVQVQLYWSCFLVPIYMDSVDQKLKPHLFRHGIHKCFYYYLSFLENACELQLKVDVQGTTKYFHEGAYFMDQGQCFERPIWHRTVKSANFYIFYSIRESDGYSVISTSKCSIEGKVISFNGLERGG